MQSSEASQKRLKVAAEYDDEFVSSSGLCTQMSMND